MSRDVPLSRCRALLKVFDSPGSRTTDDQIVAAGAYLEGALYAESFADLNEGQFAALIDLVLWKGQDAFTDSVIFNWVNNGNLTLPVVALPLAGPRGFAERDMWNLGNSE